MFKWGELATKVYPNVDEIRAKQAWELAEKGELLLIDVRKPHEVAHSGKCQGALHIPLHMVRHTADRKSPHFNPALEPSKHFALYANDHKKPLLAARMMKKLGYEHVFNMGAFREWKNAKLPVEK